MLRSFLVIHIITGSAAIAIGAVALAVRKPVADPGTRHRRWGGVFFILMLCVVGSAAVMTLLRPSAYFAGLTTSAGILVVSGVRVLRRKRPDLDPRQRAKAIDWIVALAALAIGVLLIGILTRRPVVANAPVVRALAFACVGYGLYDGWRFLRPAGFPFIPDLWLYEHIVKMIGAYFAAMAAFSGSVLVLFPSPWRQLWATPVGAALSIISVIRYRRRLRRR